MKLRTWSRLLYRIKQVDQTIATRFEEKTGFSLTRYELLMILFDQVSCSQRLLQDELGIDRAAVARHLAKLEEQGYVFRERNQENLREMEVSLTEKAREELLHCQVKHQNETHQTLMGLSAEEAEQLSRLLTKLMNGE
ncbi:MarR family winged helix-turn-helix transcriptional regulator [Vagococcus sp.]|uniref:MarR family winged helix-turn-helix transcriptional regulator n=1 Tax=Vagococcus sp. TaxID=1933889 RepID=UPI003F9CC13E